MEFTIKVEGLDKVVSKLDDLGKRQLPFALARALTQTAVAIKEDEIKEIKKVFDRPTPYTLNSLMVRPATTKSLTASVELKSPQSWAQRHHYLEPQIIGGGRELRAFEFELNRVGVLPDDMWVVPGKGIKLDAYGNIPRGQIVQIMSYFKAFREGGYAANITPEKKMKLAKGSKRRLGYSYIALQKPRGKLLPGIYQVSTLGTSRWIRSIMIFVNQSTYKKRFRFFEVGQLSALRKFNPIFHASIRDAIATAK